ncbi:cingulin-like protein 1-like, partial [Trifolium medium]|nr:cingulin-like protein 1-like [Trifolium medium]
MNPESEHTDEYYYNVLKDGLNEFKRKGSNSTKYRCPFCWNNDYHYLSDVRKHAARIVGDTRETETERAKHSALIRYIDSLDTDQDKSSAVIGQDKSSGDELFVWPWIVILANNVEKFDPKRSKYVRKNDNEIKEELLLKGFKPLKVTVLGDNKGQTPFAIVEFG